MNKKGKLKQIVLDEGLVRTLAEKAKACGIDESSFIKVLISKCEVQVLSGNTEVKMGYEEVKKEWIDPVKVKKLEIAKNAMAKVVDLKVNKLEEERARQEAQGLRNRTISFE